VTLEVVSAFDAELSLGSAGWRRLVAPAAHGHRGGNHEPHGSKLTAAASH
jgi:hypothetical protein